MTRVTRGTWVARVARVARVAIVARAARVARGIMLSYLIHPSYLSFFIKNFDLVDFIFIFGFTNVNCYGR